MELDGQVTAKAKILVIDDEPMIRWSIEQTLAAAGYNVTAAATAAEGLLLYQQVQPEVVFLDVRLPDGDGRSLLKNIKGEKAGVPAIIVMTAYGEACTPGEALQLGACHFLKKPFDFDQLEIIVADALRSDVGSSAGPAGTSNRP